MNAIQLPPIRVIKVGGSLLTWPGLREALPTWIKTKSPATNLILFGGGECVEAMRELDALWNLDPSAMHWRCVKLLDATCEIAHELWPDWEFFSSNNLSETSVDPFHLLQHFINQKYLEGSGITCLNIIIQVSSIYTREVHTLPHTWATTTDSIAAYLATVIQASELSLLKSTSPAKTSSLQALAQNGFVDDAFPDIAPPQCRIVSVDFTSANWPETLLHEPNLT
jgi:aspartokinase-like uncharacterized kinase